jgi:hypothetical protein
LGQKDQEQNRRHSTNASILSRHQMLSRMLASIMD